MNMGSWRLLSQVIGREHLGKKCKKRQVQGGSEN